MFSAFLTLYMYVYTKRQSNGYGSLLWNTNWQMTYYSLPKLFTSRSIIYFLNLISYLSVSCECGTSSLAVIILKFIKVQWLSIIHSRVEQTNQTCEIIGAVMDYAVYIPSNEFDIFFANKHFQFNGRNRLPALWARV